VAEVVSQGGYLPQLAALNTKAPFFSKKKGVLFGLLWFIFLTMFSTAFLGILNAPEELLGIIAITGVFGALMIIIGSLMLLPSSKLTVPAAHIPHVPPSQMAGGQAQALPPQRSIPVDDYAVPRTGGWRDTNDLQPTSVTEGTTRLLNENDR